MSTIQKQIKHLLRDDSKDPYFEVTDTLKGTTTKYDEASLYLMVGADPEVCDKINKLARSGKLLNNRFLINKLKEYE